MAAAWLTDRLEKQRRHLLERKDTPRPRLVMAFVDRAAGRADASQHGGGSHWRNELLHGEPPVAIATAPGAGGAAVAAALAAAAPGAWPLPASGRLELDYVGGRRPGHGSAELGEEAFSAVVAALRASRAAPACKLAALRRLSAGLCVSSVQLRRLLRLFEGPARLELVVIMFNRTVDLQNTKLWRGCLEDPADLELLRRRLGCITLHPFFQPEACPFSFDFSAYEQRVCMSVLRALESKEKANVNIQDFTFIQEDGTADEKLLKQGVPPAWSSVSQIPPAGSFHCIYRCSAADVRFKERCDKSALYLGTPPELPEDAVRWWTGVSEVPPDVLALAELLFWRHPEAGADAAFKEMDFKGNGTVKLQDFEPYLQELGCTRFKSGGAQDELIRVRAVFGFMDAGKTGQVTLQQWQVVSRLWRELDLSLRELVDFLANSSPGGLEDVWEQLGSKGEDVLTQDELTASVHKLGYFGPVRPALARFDAGESGGITRGGFRALEKYRDPAGRG